MNVEVGKNMANTAQKMSNITRAKTFFRKHIKMILLGTIIGAVAIYFFVMIIFNHKSGIQALDKVTEDIIKDNQNRVSESDDVSEGFSNMIREGFREGATTRRRR